MKSVLLRQLRSQSGFTLVELLVASAIGVIVMTGLTSVVLTTWRAGQIATGRIEASSQIRNFQFDAYDDFALSSLPASSGCGAAPWTCPINLSGTNAALQNGVLVLDHSYHVTYTWDQTNHTIDRVVGTNPCIALGLTCPHAATNVTAFNWYIDTSSPTPTVVVTLTVTVQSYAEIQTMRFYPRVNP
jgi:prepilin-type N-terminal cleavage/methylation domain-containing protein